MGEGEWEDPNSAEGLAILGLWAIPGIGPKSLDAMRATLGGDIRAALSVPVREWAPAVKLTVPVRGLLEQITDFADLAQRVTRRAEQKEIGIAFQGDPPFPTNLVGLEDAPPLLFFRGTPGPPRRRVAMVGSRHPAAEFVPRAKTFAQDLALGGLGIVSGAAQGVDQCCHEGALMVGGGT